MTSYSTGNAEAWQEHSLLPGVAQQFIQADASSLRGSIQVLALGEIMKACFLFLLAALAAGCASNPASVGADTAGKPHDIFMLRSTAKSPEAVVEAIQSYAQEKKWNYLGADKVKQGQVTLVKICIPEVGQQLWPLGLQISAMLPCGNLGMYQKDGRTEISLLHPRYMQILYPIRQSRKPAPPRNHS